MDAFRRYAIIQISETGLIAKVKVISGTVLAALDKTGTLTQKYQARYSPANELAELVTPLDTEQLLPLVKTDFQPAAVLSPASEPQIGQIMPIRDVLTSLSSLIGQTFADAGSDQERNRGGVLHKLACQALGYSLYQDDGQFPDIRNQLVEVKLQTAQTIDLGLVTPSSGRDVTPSVFSRSGGSSLRYPIRNFSRRDSGRHGPIGAPVGYHGRRIFRSISAISRQGSQPKTANSATRQLLRQLDRMPAR